MKINFKTLTICLSWVTFVLLFIGCKEDVNETEMAMAKLTAHKWTVTHDKKEPEKTYKQASPEGSSVYYFNRDSTYMTKTLFFGDTIISKGPFYIKSAPLMIYFVGKDTVYGEHPKVLQWKIEVIKSLDHPDAKILDLKTDRMELVMTPYDSLDYYMILK